MGNTSSCARRELTASSSTPLTLRLARSRTTPRQWSQSVGHYVLTPKHPPVFLFQLSFVLSRVYVWHDVITHNNIGLTKGGVSFSHRRRRAASCSAPGRPARLLQRGGGRQDHLLRLGRRHGHAHPKAVAPNSAGKWQIEHLNLSLVLTITDRQLVGAGFERVLSSEILCFSCFDKRACSVACTGRVL